MARWELLEPHYLNVPGTEWEQNETNRDTGKQVRKRYVVPRYLNPSDPDDWTDKATQKVVVCLEGKGLSRDIIFVGEPGPAMLPLDEEAEALSASLKHKWNFTPAAGDERTFTQQLADVLQSKADDVARAGPSIDTGMKDLTAAIMAMAEQNSKVIEMLASGRRV